MTKKYAVILGVLFAALTIVMRLVPHPWNFTPVGALLLYTGFILPRRYLILPLVVLAVSDFIIGAYDFRIMAAVYGSYGLLIFVSYSLRRHYSLATIFTASLGGSLLFFFITNAAVWLWSGMYPGDLSGLVMSYIAGIPFFRNSVVGDLFYTTVFFGAYEAVRYLSFLRLLVLAKAGKESIDSRCTFR